MQHDRCPMGKFSRGRKKCVSTRALSDHYDFRTAQMQIERVEQRQMSEHIFSVARREIIAAMVGIGVMRIQRMLPGQRAVEVRLLAGGLEYCEGRPDHRSIVGGQSGDQKPSGAPGMS